MRRITFPRMGLMDVSVNSFMYEIGAEPVPPPPITKRTLDLGVKNSPEFACLPLKITLGNYLETMEKGVDCIAMAGGVGPCRFGYYAEVQREILRDLGQDVKMITIEPNIWSIYSGFNYIAGGRIPLLKLYRILSFVMAKMKAVDELEKICHYVRPRTTRYTELNARFKRLLGDLEKASSMACLMRIKEEGEDLLYDLLDPTRDEVLHVGIVGEIYLLLEPSVNLFVEERLGKLGVQVHRELFLSHWVEDHILGRVDRRPYIKAGAPYLNAMIGGHGQESIGRTVLYAREGMDGVVQIAPFTCMPEIVAESIFPTLSRRENIPVLSLFFDEHSGEAGIQTRLEAFVDLIQKKRRHIAANSLNANRKEINEALDEEKLNSQIVW